MAKERSVDEYLGFARKGDKKRGDSAAASTVAVSDHGAYEDSWYQVLKAQAEEDEDEKAEHDVEV
jgi:hypothetical protein